MADPVRGHREWRALAAVVSAAALSGLQFGYDTGVISGALLKIAEEFQLSGTSQELVVAATTLGALFSSLMGAWLAGTIGRRLTLAAAAVTFVVGCIVLALAPTLWVLLLGRVTVGLAIGASSAVTPVYLAESARPSDRGWIISVNTACVTGGQMVAALVDGAVQAVPGSWRYMLGIGALPGVVQLVALLFVPESPRFLIMRGRLPEAREALAFLRGEAAPPAVREADRDEDAVTSLLGPGRPGAAPGASAPSEEAGSGRLGGALGSADVAPAAQGEGALASAAGTPPGSPARARTRGRKALRAEMLAMRSAIDDDKAAESVWSVLCSRDRPLRRAVLLAVTGQLAQQLGGVNIAMYYSASLLRQAGFDTSAAIWLAAAVAGVNFVGSLAAAYLVERAGRRPLMIWSALGAGLALVLAAVAFIVRDGGSPAVFLSEGPCGGIPLCAYCVSDERCGFAGVPSGSPPLDWVQRGVCVQGGAATGPAANVTALLGSPDWQWWWTDCPPVSRELAANGPSDSLLGWWVFGASVLFLLAFAPGLGSVPWVIQGDIFPNRARAAGNAIATATNWSANLLVSASFLSLVATLHAYGAFFIFAGAALVSALWFWWVLPETKGLALEDVRAVLGGRPIPRTG